MMWCRNNPTGSWKSILGSRELTKKYLSILIYNFVEELLKIMQYSSLIQGNGVYHMADDTGSQEKEVEEIGVPECTGNIFRFCCDLGRVHFLFLGKTFCPSLGQFLWSQHTSKHMHKGVAQIINQSWSAGFGFPIWGTWGLYEVSSAFCLFPSLCYGGLLLITWKMLLQPKPSLCISRFIQVLVLEKKCLPFARIRVV